MPSLLFHLTVAQVPSREKDMTSKEALEQFREEVPTLSLLGTTYTVHPNTPYTIDDEIQLVCKYLQAYEKGGLRGIDRLYREG